MNTLNPVQAFALGLGFGLAIAALVAWIAYQTGADNADIRWIRRNAAEIRRQREREAKARAASFDVPPVALVKPELDRDRDNSARVHAECNKTLSILAQREGGAES